jgi:hypothetical protein
VKRYTLFASIVLIMLAAAWSAESQADPLTIPEAYAGRPGIIGQVVEVEGYYYSQDWPVLVVNPELVFARREIEPHAIMKIEGALPIYMDFSYVVLTGRVEVEPRPTPLWGETEYLKLDVEIARIIEPGKVYPPRQDFLPRLRAPLPGVLADDCTFALLLCSDNEAPDMWNDMVNYWDYAKNHLGIDGANLFAFYHDGNSKNEGQIPSSALRPATHAEVQQGFQDLKDKIEDCEEQGRRAKLYKLVTDHGSGYHRGSGPDGPQNWSDGWAGGHIDRGGEEEDFVNESQLKFDFDGPAVGFMYQLDLDNDGVTDTEIRNPAGTKEVWVKTGAGWVLAGRDVDGDGDIDADDGGVDLNGDGDKNDSFAWDEDLALSNDTRDILDDEWASWQRMLSEACLDTIYELIDCCFSGGFKKDEADSIPCKTFVQKAMASSEGEYSYGTTDDAGLFAGRFMRGLMDSGWTWEQAFGKVSSDTNVTKLETPQWWWKPVAECEGIDIGIPDIPVYPGENVYVPVYIQDITGWGVMAFDMEICWCGTPAGLLQYEFCTPGEVMEGSGWAAPLCGPCGENCISVAAAGANALSGEGILFYLKFHVSNNAKPCMCCEIRFTSVNLYDPERPLQVCWTDGEVCVESCDIFGYVYNWYCSYDECGRPVLTHPIEGARLHAFDCNGPVGTTFSDAEGFYIFECLPPQDPNCPFAYCVDIDDCEVQGRLITAYDASLVLQHIVCLDDLDDCGFYTCMPVYPQRVAADVSCSGGITAYDASLILQYAVGLIPAFPCPDPWVWYESPCDGCVYSCSDGVDFFGILKGNVSGAPAVAPRLAEGGVHETRISLGNPRRSAGEVIVPVLARDAEGIFSAELEISYDSAVLEFVSASAAGLAEDFTLAQRDEDGRVRVAMAGPRSLEGDGRIATLTFSRKGQAPYAASSLSRIRMAAALFNEGIPAAVIEGNDYPDEAKIGLGMISPNPFTGATTISYSVPAASHVSVTIYNVEGRLVRTVLDGEVAAGVHSVTWDGADAAGRRLARGIYFCRMTAGDYSGTRKIVMLE